jgi:hypothetical protein
MITIAATLLKLDPGTRRVHLENDGRCFTIPLTKEQCADVGAYVGRRFTVTLELAALGVEEVGI